jgi:hypothetical protein
MQLSQLDDGGQFASGALHSAAGGGRDRKPMRNYCQCGLIFLIFLQSISESSFCGMTARINKGKDVVEGREEFLSS